MSTVLQLQRELLVKGYDIGPSGADGLIGQRTIAAAIAAVRAAPHNTTTPPVAIGGDTVPAEWMPWAQMQRIIVHWTAGGNKASSLDRKHYHIMIEGDGKLVRGNLPITANAAPIRGSYAAHTLHCNTGSIGVSLCGMAGAVESPFSAGKAPITIQQWNQLAQVVAELCVRYAIPLTRSTVLSHAEVQDTLGIKQRGKWDIARLPFNPNLKGARAVGDDMRARVQALM